MLVLSLFDHSTNFVRPWAEAGFLCYCVDLQHPPGETREGNIVRVGADVLDFIPPLGEYAFCAAFPPCTHLAASGARWFKGKGLGRLAEAIRLFHRAVQICEWTGAPYIIENPVSTISTYWRAPDYTFDPCDFGDPWLKKTCLWVGAGFVMPPKRRVLPTMGSKMHRLPPGPNRANLRSLTPPGFALAAFNANRRVTESELDSRHRQTGTSRRTPPANHGEPRLHPMDNQSGFKQSQRYPDKGSELAA